MLRRSNHHSRDYLRSDRVVRKKRRRFTFRLVAVVSILVLICISAFVVTRLDAFAVQNIVVDGNVEVSSEELVGIAKEHASSSWLYMFPRKNIMLYPTEEVEVNLRDRYPRFSEVMVTRAGINSVRISVIERSPRALWCDESQTCYNLDDQGYIYARADDISTSTDLIKFTGGSLGTSTNPIGTNINSSSTFSEIASLLQGLRDRGFSPQQVELRNNHEFAVKVHPGGNVIFSDVRPLDDSLKNFSAALESPAFKATSSPQEFEYIDTRFGNKIFFKMK